MTTVLLAPYLQLDQELRIGPWHGISAPSFERSSAANGQAFSDARGLLDLYHRSRRVPKDFGVFFARGRKKVGEEFSLAGLPNLRRSLLIGLLDGNPSDIEGEHDPNAGHRTWTSDNVDLVWHRIDRNGFVSARYGAMAQQLVGGLKIGDAHSEIAPPSEVSFPRLGKAPDEFYSQALWGALGAGGEGGSRLAAGIDWFDLAWRNTPSATYNMRIIMLKSGFEALLGEGEKLGPQRKALSALLDVPNARARTRRVPNLQGEITHQKMTDLQWWFTRLTFLRNAIAHGGVPSGLDMRHGRYWHLWIGEYRLRQAIKEATARLGHPLVRYDALGRALNQALRELGD